jgi:hypothetical protein
MPITKIAPTLDALRDPVTLRLVRPSRWDSMVVPESVRQNGQTLRFTQSVSGSVQVPAGLLESFLALGSEKEILAFAKKFGPLRLDATQATALLDKLAYKGLERPLHREGTEHIKIWWNTQQQFRLLLELAAALRVERRPDQGILERLSNLGVLVLEADFSTDDYRRKNVDEQRDGAALVLIYHLQMLARICQLQPGLTVASWDTRSLRFDLVFQDGLARSPAVDQGHLSLFGALVFQLMAAVTGTGFATCSACGKPFVPRRRPRVDQRHYCRECGRRAAVRDAKLARRRRLEEAGQKRRRHK